MKVTNHSDVDDREDAALPGSSRQRRGSTAIARKSCLREFIAEVLPSNSPMLKVFEKSGLSVSKSRELGALHAALKFP
jgi:hypothetical protein